MALKDLSVIVVDDLHTMRAIVKKMILNMGFGQIQEGVDGEDAFSKILRAAQADKPFDFIVSDWNMPNKTGLELLQMVRAHDALKHTPMLLVTAEQSKQQVLDAVKAGVNGYIVKPFTEETLLKKVKSILKDHF